LIAFVLAQALTGQQLPEGLSEVGVEDGVNDRVQGRVDVAQPSDEVDQLKVKRN
jgi:hypothetical protein